MVFEVEVPIIETEPTVALFAVLQVTLLPWITTLCSLMLHVTPGSILENEVKTGSRINSHPSQLLSNLPTILHKLTD
jgi:hypothetical protein